MAERNDEILALIRESSGNQRTIDRRIAQINSRFSDRITEAARRYPDRPRRGDKDDDENSKLVLVVVICTVSVLVAICIATTIISYRRRSAFSTPIQGFQQGDDVVVGQPVRDESNQANPFADGITAYNGSPVTVAAPMKGAATGAKTVD
jgi:hypothetical protein